MHMYIHEIETLLNTFAHMETMVTIEELDYFNEIRKTVKGELDSGWKDNDFVYFVDVKDIEPFLVEQVMSIHITLNSVCIQVKKGKKEK